MLFLVTRPEPDGSKLKAMIEALDHEAIVDPLMEVEFLPEAIDSVEGIAALADLLASP